MFYDTGNASSQASGNHIEDKDVTIAFIGGWGRSGSTLLSRMLAEVPGFIAVGELRDVFLRGTIQDRVCGCGRRFSECDFWQSVGEEAYGGWDKLSIPRIQELRRRTDKPWHLPALLNPGLRKRTDQAVLEYGELFQPLYRSIRRITGARVIVDSSKIASYAAILQRTPGLSPRMVHLVRDPRGTLNSWMKQVRMKDDLDTTRYMPRYNVVTGAARYMAYNVEMHMVAKHSPRVHLRYEDLVADPASRLREVLSIMGAENDLDVSTLIGPAGVRLGASHTVAGNPMRHESGWVELRPDEAWRTTLPVRQQQLICALTLPLMKKYGYPAGLPNRA